ncbi:hypothetical protein ASPZODRAFT_155542 [Penicilliopsis zonata CBS 506.65]|uniref:MADS-box domain-containing protein n=1 Tax=Penicilliopsis zonata CBS 506.65 TaxID=1073090 RepID=A0A1L9S4H3_9EURO|nr:hypothetical protein ASPZODRAFT_155542 [Penicilliopsis zonata CBS 506.65]OJJ42060.1 hypothetical protein ASPZODRAFT_155542 [Penicilliopsis zonata CBS 506.65]
MAAKRSPIGRRRSNSPRSIRQQQTRRRNSLLRKSFEYCRECDADVFMMIRLRHNGQIVFFNSDSQWPLSREQLASHYPKPQEITWNELAAKYSSPKICDKSHKEK